MVAEVRSGQDSRHHEQTQISLGTWQIALKAAIASYLTRRNAVSAANSTESQDEKRTSNKGS